MLYDVDGRAATSTPSERRRIRQLQAKPIADTLREWLTLHRQRAYRRDGHRQGDRLQPGSVGGAHPLSRRRQLPIDNNWIENRIRPIALGTIELAVRRLVARRPARGGSDEPDPVGEAQRARPLPVSEGRAATRCRRIPASRIEELLAASLGPDRHRHLSNPRDHSIRAAAR